MPRSAPAEPPIRVESAIELDFSSDWRARPHAHAHHEELMVVTRGDLEIYSGAETLLAPEGSVVLYPRTVRHAEKPVPAGRVRLLCLLWRAPARPSRGIMVRGDPDGRLQTAARWVADWKSRNRPESGRAISLLMANILLELQSPPPVLRDEFAQRAKAYMQRHLAEPLDLLVLSKAAGLSKCHFAAEFTRVTGRPPMHFLRSLRLQAAEYLMQTTAMPLRTIAALVGLKDEYHFSRVFRRERGVAPSVARQER